VAHENNTSLSPIAATQRLTPSLPAGEGKGESRCASGPTAPNYLMRRAKALPKRPRSVGTGDVAGKRS